MTVNSLSSAVKDRSQRREVKIKKSQKNDKRNSDSIRRKEDKTVENYTVEI